MTIATAEKISPDQFRLGAHDWLGGQLKTPMYPPGPSDGGVTEDKHDITVKDPWRSLEDLDLQSTQDFINAQNELSEPYLASHPRRRDLENAVEASLSYTKTTCPQLQADGWYYWLHNDGLYQRNIMLRSRDLPKHYGKSIREGGEEGVEVVFDPNLERGISLYMYSWSPSGKLLSLILQNSGSDWQTIRTINTDTKQPIDVELSYAKFTFGATFLSEQGIFYKGLIDRPKTLDQMGHADSKFGIHFHVFGTAQEEDVVVWQPDPTAGTQFVGRPRVLSGDEKEGSGRRRWFYLDVYRNTNPQASVLIVEVPKEDEVDGIEKIGSVIATGVKERRRWLTNNHSGLLTYIGTVKDDRHLFKSDTDGVTAGRVVSYDMNDYDASSSNDVLTPTEIVPADPEGHVLLSAHLVAETVLILVYLRHACAAVVFVDVRTGRPVGKTDARGTAGEVVADGPIDLPVPEQQIIHSAKPPVMIPKHASITTVTSRPDSYDFYMAVDTYVSTPYVLGGQVTSGPHGVEVDIHGLGVVAEKKEDLVCRQVFYESHDGTKIPMFIAHRADLDLSKPQLSLLYAYGGYAIPVLPHFDPFFTSFMRNCGGILAVPGIRGGGEYGKPWHEAALGANRWVAWDDQACAAKYLHQQGISSPELTTAFGTSNGGLLVAASLVRHPELFVVVIPEVPVIDLTRFHKFTLGKIYIGEFGNPDDPEMLKEIVKLSPLHNVDKTGKEYPAVLVTTGDHDNRVIPGHTLKFIAELQDSKRRNRRALMSRIYRDAGHEVETKTVKEKVSEAVDRLVFILLNTRPT